MSTGRSIVSTCAAAVPIAGNPSDEFGGAAIALPIADLTAMAAVRKSPTGSFSHRPTDTAPPGLADEAADAYVARFGTIPPVELSLSSSIPPDVGLAAGSALIIAMLRALAAADSRSWDPPDLVEVTSSILGDADQTGPAVLHLQAIGGPGAVSFAADGVESIDIPDDINLFIAWSPTDTTDTTEPITATMRSLRRRFGGRQPELIDAVTDWKHQAERARRGLVDDDVKLVADAMHRTLAVRLRVTEISSIQRRLIEIGRGAGAAVNTPGVAGSVVGIARHVDQLEVIERAYGDVGLRTMIVD